MPSNKLTMRKMQALATRQKIFDTAVSLFTRKGYDNVTIDDICNKLGLSKGAFYAHFKSKDQIIIEKFMAADDYYRDYALKEVSTLQNGADRLMAFFRLALRHIIKLGKANMQIALHSQIRFDKKATFINLENRALFTIALSLIEDAQKSGEIRVDLTSRQLARALISSFRGIVYDWCLPTSKFDLEEAGEDLVAILRDSLLRK